ncbi:hypothetical protein B296_00057088 [Ensete ventricosum]|uniref:Uncharacterized protein n=1 Tax=Ensete ventricosum TaxID=4639 RepID=A0A426X2X9_ENSVE|nr:hypothetical protein B296_00057088 [Ensete ventricosum]
MRGVFVPIRFFCSNFLLSFSLSRNIVAKRSELCGFSGVRCRPPCQIPVVFVFSLGCFSVRVGKLIPFDVCIRFPGSG